MSSKNLCWIVPGFQASLFSFPHVAAQGSVGSHTFFPRETIVSEVNLVNV